MDVEKVIKILQKIQVKDPQADQISLKWSMDPWYSQNQQKMYKMQLNLQKKILKLQV